METTSVNQQAFKLVQEVMALAERLKVKVSRFANGATLIDMGQRCPGSWLAGQYYARITMGGLAEVTFETMQLDEYALPAVRVCSADPLLVGWVCQKHVEPPLGADTQPIFCGPAKALLYPCEESVAFAGYHDASQVAVASFQTAEPIADTVADRLAHDCRVSPENLYILVAPSTSLTCSIQVAARPIDQVMHRLQEEGFDIHAVRYATGVIPIAPLCSDELMALGRINDCMLYGGSVMLYVEGDDAEIARMMPELPTMARAEYGKTFQQILLDNDGDFHKIDRRLHSMALVHINNITSGRTFSSGEINRAMLRRSFGLS
jgi:methenyltetrahydromethanopterin cyclohydrolase